MPRLVNPPEAVEATVSIRRRARELLADGMSDTEVARALTVHPTTVARWRRRPDFRAKLEAVQEARIEAAQSRMMALQGKAIGVWAATLDDPDASAALKCDVATKIIDRSLTIADRRAARVAPHSTQLDEQTAREQLRALKAARPHLFEGLDAPQTIVTPEGGSDDA